MSRFIVTYLIVSTVFFWPAFIFSSESITAQQADEATELRFWHPYTGTRAEALDVVVDDFNAAHSGDISIEARSFQNAGLLYDQLILQLNAEQNLPNLVQVWPHEAALFDLTGRVRDVGAVMPNMDSTTTLDPLLLAQEAVTGKVLGVPLHLYAYMLYVNLDALAELGYAEVPRSLVELQAMACAFQDANGWSGGRFGVVSGFTAVTDGELVQTLGAAEGEAIFRTERFNTTSGGLQNGLMLLADMASEGCLTATPTRAESIDRFASGRSLFYVDTSASLRIVEDAVALNFARPFAWGAFAMPGERVFVSAPVLSVFESTPAENAAAGVFLRWLLQPEQNAAWVSAIGGVPLNNASLNLVPADNNLARVADVMQNSEPVPMPVLAGYDVLRLEMQFAFDAILADPGSANSQLATLESTLNTIWPTFYGRETPSEGETP